MLHHVKEIITDDILAGMENMPLIPSGPAAELALIDQTACFSSSFVAWPGVLVLILSDHARNASKDFLIDQVILPL
uniref:Putative ovule protein n=1 Tax=Solanum chacoense TaxID=4108 RepID=A0A0V0HDJ7_SOLCH